MTDIEKTQFFDGKKVRTVWDEEKQEWFFSIKDVVSILAETTNAKDYIAKMRRRDPELSKGWGQIVHPPYSEDTKLNNGTAFVKIKNSSSSRRRHGSDIVIEYYQDVPYDMIGGNSEYVDLGLSVNH